MQSPCLPHYEMLEISWEELADKVDMFQDRSYHKELVQKVFWNQGRMSCLKGFVEPLRDT